MQIFAPKKIITSYGILVCSLAGIFYAYEFLLRVLPGALQNELMQAWGNISAGMFGQISALYYFAYSPMQLPVGLLTDRYGPRRVLTVACFLCALGSWLFLQTSHLALVGVGRFLVGLGSSFAFVGLLFLGHHWLPRRYFSLLVGLVTTFAMLSLIFGVVQITALVSQVGLVKILAYLALFGLLLSGVMYSIMRDGPAEKQVLHSQSWSLFFKEVWQVLTDFNVWLIGGVGALFYTSLSVFGELWGKAYLENAQHLTNMQAAEAISCVFLGWAIGAPLIGYFSDHIGHRIKTLLIGALLGGASICVVLYVPDLSFSMISGCLFFYGIVTSSEIIIFVMAKEICEAKLAGTVFSVTNMIVMLGGMLLQPAVGYLLDWHAVKDLATQRYLYTVADYQLALSVLPLALIVSVGLLGYLGMRSQFTLTAKSGE